MEALFYLNELETGESLFCCFHPHHETAQRYHLLLILQPIPILQQSLQLLIHLSENRQFTTQLYKA